MVLRNKRRFSLYQSKLTERARELRKNATFGEVLLWGKLKGRQLLGYKFIKQIPILKFIVDFYCRELTLIIEIDGFGHDGQLEYDDYRQKDLEKEGHVVLRFQEWEVRRDIDNVIQRIVDCIETRKGLTPPVSPPQGGI